MGDEGREWRFTIPTLPPSANALHDIIYRERRVVLKPSVIKWKSDAKLFIPRITIAADSLVEIQTTFYYRHYYANGSLRRFDTQNLLKCLIDTIANKIGFDDSRVKTGSWVSIDSRDEKVVVRLRECQLNPVTYALEPEPK